MRELCVRTAVAGESNGRHACILGFGRLDCPYNSELFRFEKFRVSYGSTFCRACERPSETCGTPLPLLFWTWANAKVSTNRIPPQWRGQSPRILRQLVNVRQKVVGIGHSVSLLHWYTMSSRLVLNGTDADGIVAVVVTHGYVSKQRPGTLHEDEVLDVDAGGHVALKASAKSKLRIKHYIQYLVKACCSCRNMPDSLLKAPTSSLDSK